MTVEPAEYRADSRRGGNDGVSVNHKDIDSTHGQDAIGSTTGDTRALRGDRKSNGLQGDAAGVIVNPNHGGGDTEGGQRSTDAVATSVGHAGKGKEQTNR